MRVLLIGHGKMGKAIEQLATQRGHEIAGIIDDQSASKLSDFSGSNADVAIEFTQPDVAVGNIIYCLENKIPVISGTTGWLEHLTEVERVCSKYNGTLLYASNFSLGVNLFFKLNQWLANSMEGHGYSASIEETHHIHKKDAPSGTAITLAEGLIDQTKNLTNWTLDEPRESEVPIKAIRENEIPGTHTVNYRSEVDQIEIKHEAFSRQGFVNGAVLVAEWIVNREGMLTMDDFLSSAVKL